MDRIGKGALLLLMLTTTIAAGAEPAPSAPPSNPDAGTVHRLSPEEVKRILATASERPEIPADGIGLGLGGERDRQVHGEMGVMVGTGGARSVFGSAIVPLGDRGTAAMSFETGRYPVYERRVSRSPFEPF